MAREGNVTPCHISLKPLSLAAFSVFFHLNLLLLVFIAACALQPLEEAETRLSRGARHLLSANFLAAGKAMADMLQSFIVSRMNN